MRVVLFVSREFRSTDYEKGLKRRYLFSNAPEENNNLSISRSKQSVLNKVMNI